jgi:hypothetical protein
LDSGGKKSLIKFVDIVIPGVVALCTKADKDFLMCFEQCRSGVDIEPPYRVKAELIAIRIPYPFIGFGK